MMRGYSRRYAGEYRVPLREISPSPPPRMLGKMMGRHSGRYRGCHRMPLRETAMMGPGRCRQARSSGSRQADPQRQCE